MARPCSRTTERRRWCRCHTVAACLLLLVGVCAAVGQPSVAAREPPPGYQRFFAADFSSTTITPRFEWQWWYVLSGVENGVDWSSTRQLGGGTGLGFVIQPLMYSPNIQPFEYQEARIMAEGTNKFLRLVNRKRDGNRKSRVQLMASFEKREEPIEGFYSRISFRLGSDMQSKLRRTWLDLVEVHDIGGGTCDRFRQSLYIEPDRDTGKSCYRLQLRNETRNQVVYRMKLAEFTGWDHWETLGFQFEAVAADRPARVRVWVNGRLVGEKNDIPAGYPIRNFHPVKAYIDNSTSATVPLVLDVDSWEFWLKSSPR